MYRIAFFIFSLVFGVSLLSTIALPNYAYASCESEGVKVFSIPAWYRGLVDDNCKIKKIGQEEGKGVVTVQEFVWTIIGNIFDGLMKIVGLAAIGYLIWGGIQYIISAGDSSKMSSAKATIINAITGLIITVLGSAIVQFLLGVF